MVCSSSSSSSVCLLCPDFLSYSPVCGIYLGGNDYDLQFYSTNTNLHKVWDTDIPLVQLTFTFTPLPFFQNLFLLFYFFLFFIAGH